MAEDAAIDSRPATSEHIAEVRGLVLGVAGDLVSRGHRHDASKLEEPERATFDRVTTRLRSLTHGSEEYEEARKGMGPALDHHYEVNDHHPEHFEGGIADMNLIQLTEMLCDWIAATRRHDDGDIRRSIDDSADRFGYGEELRQLLHNSVDAILELEVRIPTAVPPPTDSGKATN